MRQRAPGRRPCSAAEPSRASRAARGGRGDRRHGCILPGAGDVAAFWAQHPRQGRRRSPRSRPSAGTGASTTTRTAAARDKVYSRWGGFVDDVPFDPLAFGMPPNSLRLDRAVPAAGAADRAAPCATPATQHRPFDRERTSVILGAGGGGADLAVGYTVRSTLAGAPRTRRRRGLTERLGRASCPSGPRTRSPAS